MNSKKFKKSKTLKKSKPKLNATYPYGNVSDAGYTQTLLKIPDWSDN